MEITRSGALEGVRVEDLPADLAALLGRRAIMSASGDHAQLTALSRALQTGLDEGRWTILRGQAYHYRDEAALAVPRPPSWDLAAALADAWRDVPGSSPRGQRTVVAGGRRVLVLWRASLPRTARLKPIEDPGEMGSTVDAAATRDELARSLASYVRSIVAGNSPFDRFVAGDDRALSADEQDGLRLFRGKANCTACHIGPTLSDEQFHNTGVAWADGRFQDEGRAGVTGSHADRGAFKTPTLREVARTAPYMHDGSLGSLEDVIEFYDRGGRTNRGLDSEVRPLRLTETEKRQLVSFLRALSGEVVEGRRPSSDPQSPPSD